MSSTFGSLNIAKTGLQYQQVAIDTANNNIANVNTDGYVRRRAVAAEVGGPGQPTMWSYYDGHGQGVTTQSVQRLTDILLDNRVRKENANLSYLAVQQTAMERVETAINEPTDNGVAHALSDFGSAWHDVVITTNGEAARSSVLAAGATLASAINAQARALDSELTQQQAGAAQDIKDINDDAQQLAQLNHNIFIAQANGNDVSDLMDQRDKLALDLSQKAGAEVSIDSTGRYDITINGVTLVDGDKAGTIQQTDVDPSTGTSTNGAKIFFQITDPVALGSAASTNTTDITTSLSGDLGGVATLINVRLSDYRAKLNDMAKNLATVVNAQHEAGLDKNGDPGDAFFSFDPDDPAGTIAVAITDPAKVAAAAAQSVDPATGKAIAGTASNDATNADLISQVLDGKATAAVPASGGVTGANAVDIKDQYQSMVSGLGSAVAGLNQQTASQQLLTNQVSDERQQMAGVSLDEETINLMAAQRAYEASSRVLTVMNSILDTLINRMGA
jgi:flagellar hook-associated protein 1